MSDASLLCKSFCKTQILSAERQDLLHLSVMPFYDERMCFAVSHDREEKHLIGVVKAKAIIGHGIAAVGGFHLIAAEFLTG